MIDLGDQILHGGVALVPMKFSGSSAKAFYAPPALGRDTQSVLSKTLGYGAERIAALQRDRVVQ